MSTSMPDAKRQKLTDSRSILPILYNAGADLEVSYQLRYLHSG
jgi:hypothetical protein